jgi:hypothetical protein
LVVELTVIVTGPFAEAKPQITNEDAANGDAE